MRSIIVHADSDPAGRSRIESALSLARMTRGHVNLIVDTPVTRFVTIDGMGGGTYAAEAIRDAVDQDDAFAREINAELASQDVPYTVLRSEAEPVNALAEAARLGDVVVVSRRNALANDLPLASRCPVLAINDDPPLTFPLASAAIAWDGSSEAAYALRCAVPLLAEAQEDKLLTVEHAPAGFPATDALSFLSRHDVRAELQVLQRLGAVEETLARELAIMKADLLVMGAYGHSRLREFLFGGVTRYFLSNPGGPALLLAH